MNQKKIESIETEMKQKKQYAQKLNSVEQKIKEEVFNLKIQLKLMIIVSCTVQFQLEIIQRHIINIIRKHYWRKQDQRDQTRQPSMQKFPS